MPNDKPPGNHKLSPKAAVGRPRFGAGVLPSGQLFPVAGQGDTEDGFSAGGGIVEGALAGVGIGVSTMAVSDQGLATGPAGGVVAT